MDRIYPCQPKVLWPPILAHCVQYLHKLHSLTRFARIHFRRHQLKYPDVHSFDHQCFIFILQVVGTHCYHTKSEKHFCSTEYNTAENITSNISGMYCYYNQAMYHSLMYRLAITNGCRVILCGQKLAPEFPFPNAVIEAYQVYLKIVYQIYWIFLLLICW